MAITHPFGQPDKARKSDNAPQSKTPQQKKFERATGKDSSSPVGDVAKKESVPTETKAEQQAPGVPKGVNKDVWAQAESAVIGKNGGFSGVGEEGRRNQIQEVYDQLVEQDKKDKAWAGEGKENGILGDI